MKAVHCCHRVSDACTCKESSHAHAICGRAEVKARSCCCSRASHCIRESKEVPSSSLRCQSSISKNHQMEVTPVNSKRQSHIVMPPANSGRKPHMELSPANSSRKPHMEMSPVQCQMKSSKKSHMEIYPVQCQMNNSKNHHMEMSSVQNISRKCHMEVPPVELEAPPPRITHKASVAQAPTEGSSLKRLHNQIGCKLQEQQISPATQQNQQNASPSTKEQSPRHWNPETLYQRLLQEVAKETYKQCQLNPPCKHSEQSCSKHGDPPVQINQGHMPDAVKKSRGHHPHPSNLRLAQKELSDRNRKQMNFQPNTVHQEVQTQPEPKTECCHLKLKAMRCREKSHKVRHQKPDEPLPKLSQMSGPYQVCGCCRELSAKFTEDLLSMRKLSDTLPSGFSSKSVRIKDDVAKLYDPYSTESKDTHMMLPLHGTRREKHNLPSLGLPSPVKKRPAAVKPKQKPHEPLDTFVTKQGFRLSAQDLIDTKVTAPMIRRVQRIYQANLVEQMKLVRELDSIPKLVKEMLEEARQK